MATQTKLGSKRRQEQRDLDRETFSNILFSTRRYRQGLLLVSILFLHFLTFVERPCTRQQSRVPVDKIGLCGSTALIMHIESGSLEAVKALLEANADPNLEAFEFSSKEKPLRRTPLMAAAAQGNVDIIRVLVKHGANVNLGKVEDKATPVYIAAQTGMAHAISCLAELGADLNSYLSDRGATPSLVAANQGHTNVIQELVHLRADFNKPTWDHKLTPFFVACQQGHLDIVKILVENKNVLNIDINQTATAFINATPLYAALACNRYDVVRYLVKEGADMNIAAKDETILQKAVRIKDVDLVKFLIKHGADVNQVIMEGEITITPLMIAVSQQQEELVRVLCRAGAIIGRPKSACALVVACELNSLPLLQLLGVYNLKKFKKRNFSMYTNLMIFDHFEDDSPTTEWVREVREWTALRVAVACRMHDDLSWLLSNGWADPWDEDRAQLLDALKPSKTHLSCSQTQRTVHDALKPWSPRNHYLWPRRARELVKLVMLVAYRLRNAFFEWVTWEVNGENGTLNPQPLKKTKLNGDKFTNELSLDSQAQQASQPFIRLSPLPPELWLLVLSHISRQDFVIHINN
eukprot:m.267605 g.267605  ORF g.267605 m.267605 type:complete len:580 (+) comp16250_c0_seq1:372-2111(+)